MSLELKPIDDSNIEVYSNLKLAGTMVRPEIPTPPDGTFKWFFKPNSECNCVWTDVSLIELGTIIKNMNNEIIKKLKKLLKDYFSLMIDGWNPTKH